MLFKNKGFKMPKIIRVDAYGIDELSEDARDFAIEQASGPDSKLGREYFRDYVKSILEEEFRIFIDNLNVFQKDGEIQIEGRLNISETNTYSPDFHSIMMREEVFFKNNFVDVMLDEVSDYSIYFFRQYNRNISDYSNNVIVTPNYKKGRGDNYRKKYETDQFIIDKIDKSIKKALAYRATELEISVKYLIDDVLRQINDNIKEYIINKESVKARLSEMGECFMKNGVMIEKG
jgi:hypothetical protein